MKSGNFKIKNRQVLVNFFRINSDIMNFQYFRFFLNKTDQLSILPKKVVSTDELIKNIFSDKYDFEFSHIRYSYLFQSQVEDVIHAKFGRRSEIERILPPEKNFEKEMEENWPYSNVFVKVSRDPEKGQIIAFECAIDKFRKPSGILQKLAEEISEKLLEHGYLITIHPITIEYDFWETIEKYSGTIEEVTFTYAAPNLFGVKDTMTQELKHAAENFSITQAVISLKNVIGKLNIPKDDRFINESVDYVTKGGGDYKIIGNKRKTITSKTRTKTKEVEVTEEEETKIAIKDETSLSKIIDQIFND